MIDFKLWSLMRRIKNHSIFYIETYGTTWLYFEIAKRIIIIDLPMEYIMFSKNYQKV